MNAMMQVRSRSGVVDQQGSEGSETIAQHRLKGHACRTAVPEEYEKIELIEKELMVCRGSS